MKVHLDESLCVGHGRCYELSAAVFSEDECGHAVLLCQKIPREHEAAARKAELNCPEDAIRLEED
ncbi:MAG: ferredoxin [bacterium]|nr:hypothetical protein [Deltaproteobacteria bacterium]MCP4908545.1 ferredoxin [bacterium]